MRNVLLALVMAISVLFVSCDKLQKLYDKEKTAHTEMPEHEATSEQQKAEHTPYVEDTEKKETSKFLTPPKTYTYYQRGNNVTLTPDSKNHSLYELSMQGVGKEIIEFTNTKDAPPQVYRIHYQTLHEDFFKEEQYALLVILRNSSAKVQKDVPVPVIVKTAVYDPTSQTSKYLIDPQVTIQSKFIGASLGTAILLFQNEPS